MRMSVAAVLLLSFPAVAAAQVEWTEHKSPAAPTADEQLVLEIINRARANPFAEGARLATFSPYPLPNGDITEGLTNPGNVGVRPPLAMNGILVQTARTHSADMYAKDYFAHESVPSGDTPGTRATNAGYLGDVIGENIATSSSGTAAFLEDFLMVDWLSTGGYPGRGHRRNLLDVNSGAAPFREIGVGYYLGASQRPSGYKDFLTEDFGRRDSVGPFALGVVYSDTVVADNFYTVGEGVNTIDVRRVSGGTHFAVTGTAGGYAFPIATSGTVVLRASGGAFGSGVYKAVTLRGANVKVDFKTSDTSIVDTDQDGLPDSWETTHFAGPTQNAGGDPDGDTFTNVEELNAGTDPMDPNSKPAVPSAPPPSPKKNSDGGGCGLTGWGAVLPLLLGRLRRRR
jgi:hypothetical protein